MVVFNEKKKPKKSSNAELANRPDPKFRVVLLSEIRQYLSNNLGMLGQVFQGTGDIAPARIDEAYSALKDAAKLIEDIQKVAKQRIQELVKKSGELVPETKGTIRSESLGYELRPTRTGFDSKKVEALFRAKGVDVNKYMDPVVTYVISDNKLLAAAADGVLSKDELEACRYDESYSVWKSKTE